MGTLSKTADAARKAVAKGEQKAKEVWTPERTIKNIRSLVSQGLYVPADQWRVLLAEYDKLLGIFGNPDSSCPHFQAAEAVWDAVMDERNDLRAKLAAHQPNHPSESL